VAFAQQNAWAWIRLCKPRTSSFYLISALIGMFLFVPRPIQLWPTVSVFLVYVVAAGIYILNDVYDVDIDSVSAPDRPLPAGIIGVSTARTVAVILLISGPVAAAAVDIQGAVLLGVLSLLGVAYSVPPVRLRRFFLAPSLMIGVGNALGFLIGAVLSQGTPLTAKLLLGGFLLVAFHTGPSMTKDLSDVEGHRKSGIRSLPVLIGLERAARITAVLGLASFVFAFLFLYLFGFGRLAYAAMLACMAFAAFSLKRLLSNVNDQENVVRSFQLFALSGLGALAAMVLGSLAG